MRAVQSRNNPMVSTLSFIYFLIFCILGYTSSYLGAIFYTLESITNANIDVLSFIFSCRSIGFVFGSASATFITNKTLHAHRYLSIVILISVIPLIWIIFVEDIVSLFFLVAIQGYTMGYFETSLTTYLVRLYSNKIEMENALQTLHFCFGIGAFLSPLFIEIAILSSSKSNDFSYSFIFVAGLSIFPSMIIFFVPTPIESQNESLQQQQSLNQCIHESSLLTPTKHDLNAGKTKKTSKASLTDQILDLSPQKYKLSAHQHKIEHESRKYKKLISVGNSVNSTIEMRELSPLKISNIDEDIDTDDLTEYQVNNTYSHLFKIQNVYRIMLLLSCIIISLMYGGLEVILGGFISNYFIKQYSMSPMYATLMTAIYYGAMCFGSWIYEKISNRFMNSKLLLIGFIFCFIISGLLMLLSDYMILVIISTAFCGLFMSGLFPGTYSLIEQSKYNLNLNGNKVASIFVSGYCIGEILIPPLVGNWIMYSGIYYFMVSIFILCTVNLILYIFTYFCHHQFYQLMTKLNPSSKSQDVVVSTPFQIKNDTLP